MKKVSYALATLGLTFATQSHAACLAQNLPTDPISDTKIEIAPQDVCMSSTGYCGANEEVILPAVNYAFCSTNPYSPLYPNANFFKLPQFPGGFEIGIDALYVRPYQNQLEYGIVGPALDINTVPSVEARAKTISPHYTLGYGVDLSYIFPRSPYDVSLHYFRVREQNDSSVVAPPGQTVITILSHPILETIFPTSANSASASISLEAQTAHVEFGHRILGGSNLIIRLLGGFSYAELESDMNVIYRNTDILTTNGISQESHFRGYGPRVGADVQYYFGNGVGLATHLAAAFFYGDIDSSINERSSLGISTAINGNSITRAVPSLDMKLGLNFNYQFTNTSKIQLELGYMRYDFFNAMDTFRYTNWLGARHLKLVHDFTVDGPYLNVTYTGLNEVLCSVPCGNFDVTNIITSPRLPGGFEFGLELLYLKPYDYQLDYALSDPTPIFVIDDAIINSQNSSLKTIEPDYDFGFGVHFGYTIPTSAYDLALNYKNLNTSDRDDANAPPGGTLWDLWGPFGELLPEEFPLRANAASAKSEFKYHAANLEVGHHIIGGNCFDLRLMTGIDYANLKQDFTVNYFNGTTAFLGTTVALETMEQNSKFSGIGPRIGLDGRFNLGAGLGVFGHAAGNLLVGTNKSDFQDLSSLGVQSVLNRSSQSRLVPSIDTKLAATYSFLFNSVTRFIIELGYQVDHYFNVFDHYRLAGVEGLALIKQTVDLNLAGPYLSVNITGLGGIDCLNECFASEEPLAAFIPRLCGLDIGVSALYLRASTDHLDFGIIDPIAPTFPGGFDVVVPSQVSEITSLSPNYRLGYDAHLGYTFPSTAADIALHYQVLHASDSDRAVAPVGGSIRNLWQGPDTTTLFALTAQFAQARISFDYNAGNIEVGYHGQALCDFDVRLATGVGYASIDRNFNVTYRNGRGTATAADFFIEDSVSQESKFSGVGPRFGIDINYNIAPSFGVIAHAAGDFLIGNLNSKLSQFARSTVSVTSTAIDPESKTRLVLGSEGKLGAFINFYLSDTARISLEGGYLLVKYFNAIDSYDYTVRETSFFAKHEDDFWLDGPYLILKLTI